MGGNQRGGRRQGASGQQQSERPQQFSANEQMSLQQKLEFVLGQLKTRRPEIEAVLPADLPFEKFHATINQGLRNNPKILKCTGVSIVNACVKSAYDGLRLDGKEAALVDHSVNVGTKAQPRYENHAEYFPMVRGLIKKILMSKKVIAMEAEAIHQNDIYRVVRGTNPEIYHEPRLDGDRGPMIAFYSVATLESGHRTAEFMTKADVEDVRKEAKTQFVWDRWYGEMGKKSVIRRHEKKLPSGRDMIDVEAQVMFPHFDRTQPHPQLAPSPRPQRAPAALEDNSGNFGVPLDMNMAPDEGALVEQEREEQQPTQARQAEEALDIPSDPAEWAMWEADVLGKIAKAADVEAVNAVFTENRAAIEQAEEAVRNKISKEMTDRIAELAAGGDA